MKKAMIVVALGVLAILGMASCHLQAAPGVSVIRATDDRREIPASRYASSVVKITIDVGIVGLDSKAVEGLLRSDEVGGRAAREVIGLSFGEGLGFISVEEIGVSSTRETAGHHPALGPRPTVEPTDGAGWTSGESLYAGSRICGYRGYVDPPFGPFAWGSWYEPRRQLIYSCPGAEKRLERPVERTLLVRLEVDLSESFKPVAREFLDRAIDYVRDALMQGYAGYAAELSSRLEEAQVVRERARSRFSAAIEEGTAAVDVPEIGLEAADDAVYRQLDEIVDLSELKATMTLREAIAKINNAVTPPLKTVVLWSDLYENADVKPTTEINVEGLSEVRLQTGLESLLKAVAKGLGEDIGYVVEDGVITVATAEALPRKLETRVYEIPAVIRASGSTQNLTDLIMAAVEPDSWYEMSATGQGEITSYLATKLVILQTRKIHIKIKRLLKEVIKDMPAVMGGAVTVDVLAERLRDLQSDKERLGTRVDSLSELQLEQLKENDRRKKELVEEVRGTVKNEMQASITRVQRLKGSVAGANLDGAEVRQLDEIIEEMHRLGDKVAKSIEDSRSSSYAPWDRSEKEMRLENELTLKRSALSGVNSRIFAAEGLLLAREVIDPDVSQIRLAARELEQADSEVYELETRLSRLRKPSVTVIGAH